jgi:DNA-binding MarR family transcriptional regulator
MAQTVSDLEADGFVTRRPDPDDRRRALVELTAEGQAALAADRAQREGWLARAIAEELSTAEVDVLESALELLRRLAES